MGAFLLWVVVFAVALLNRINVKDSNHHYSRIKTMA
jgi:hypothetical protein